MRPLTKASEHHQDVEVVEDDHAISSSATPKFAATTGEATVASLLSQRPARGSLLEAAATPAPKLSRPSLAASGLAESSAGFASTAPSSVFLGRRPAAGSSMLSTAGTAAGGLSDGPKRIIRAPPATQPVQSEPETSKERRVATEHTAESLPVSSVPTQASKILAAQLSTHEVTAASAMEAAAAVPQPVFVLSADSLRTMLGSAEWSERVKALEYMTQRLQRATDASEAVSDSLIDTFLDLSTPLLGDPHHKVATDALTVVQHCVSSFPAQITSRLGTVALALFHRLADRRQVLRDAANGVLNLLRTRVDGVLLMGALSPRMVEVPDRMKTALMQFLGAVAPRCEEFFLQATHSRAFLGRMAHILEGSAGVKPSATLTVAARRLLELVFKTAPSVCTYAVSFSCFRLVNYRYARSVDDRWSARRLLRCRSSSRSF